MSRELGSFPQLFSGRNTTPASISLCAGKYNQIWLVWASVVFLVTGDLSANSGKGLLPLFAIFFATKYIL